MTRQEYNREASSQATCNWVEVRNKAAIAAMQGILSNCNGKLSPLVFANTAKYAISFADALVKQLKGE